MHKGNDLDCKVLSVMMRHLNILKYFSFGIESLWTYSPPQSHSFFYSLPLLPESLTSERASESDNYLNP